MTATRRVLLVEDDAHIADLLALHLRDEGLEVVHCARGDDGLRELERGTWDALVLDIMLPGVDGLEICRRARAMARYTPIIIISARSSEVHRILGLEIGADDYLAKPFSVLELVARVKALLRRVEALAQNARLESGSLTIAGLAMDPVARDARLHGARLDLTSTRATSTPSIPTSTACAPRSRPIRPSPHASSPSGDAATSSPRRARAHDHETAPHADPAPVPGLRRAAAGVQRHLGLDAAARQPHA
jgi:DNA-binding response OmpR family regulator